MPESGQSEEHRILERLALAEWSSSTAAEVVSVTVVGDRAEVHLVVDDDYEYWQYFQRAGRAWREAIGGNAPCAGWADPAVIEWDFE